MESPAHFDILVIPLTHVLGPKYERQQRPRNSEEFQTGATWAMTSAVGGNPLPESLSGPCRRLRYHEPNTHKVTKKSAQSCRFLCIPEPPHDGSNETCLADGL
jgi:hypothetical protein